MDAGQFARVARNNLFRRSNIGCALARAMPTAPSAHPLRPALKIAATKLNTINNKHWENQNA